MTREKLLARLVPVLLAALSWRIHRGALSAVDVGFDDETVYLEGKRSLATDSPLYPLFYRVLAAFTSDPVDRYLLAWLVLSSVLPLLVYALARRSGAGIPAAIIVALVQLLSHSNEAWPYVGAFASAVLALGAIALTYVPAPRRPLALALNGALASLVSFARPELVFPAVALGALAVALSLKSWKSERVTIGVALAAVAAPVVRHDDGGRSFFAFQQHYAFNLSSAGDPWNQFEPVARAAFPTAKSITGAALENPSAFASHLGRNVMRLVPALWDLVSPVGYLPLAYAVALTIALGAVLAFARRADLDARLRVWLPLMVAVAVGALAASLLIHPRRHYLQPLLTLALALAAGATHGHTWARERRAHVVMIGFAALLLVLPVKCGDAWSLFAPRKHSRCEDLPERATITALRRLELPPKLVLVEPDYSRAIYVGRPFEQIPQHEKPGSLRALIDERHVNVIVVNQRTRAHPTFTTDPDFRHFDDGTLTLPGFTRLNVPNTDVVLGVAIR